MCSSFKQLIQRDRDYTISCLQMSQSNSNDIQSYNTIPINPICTTPFFKSPTSQVHNTTQLCRIRKENHRDQRKSIQNTNTENLALGTKPIETEVQVLLIITFFDKPINHYPPGPRIQQKAKFSWISINLQSSPISNNNSKQTSSFIRKVENNREKREREKQ